MKQHKYTREEILHAYQVWAALDFGDSRREEAWDSYVDARDGHPPGDTARRYGRFYTTAAVRQRVSQHERRLAKQAAEEKVA